MLAEHLVFIDSFQFRNSTLDKLASDLPKIAFKYTSEQIKNAKNLKLMKQVSIFMITLIHLIGSMKKKLPTKDDFYSILNNEH